MGKNVVEKNVLRGNLFFGEKFRGENCLGKNVVGKIVSWGKMLQSPLTFSYQKMLIRFQGSTSLILAVLGLKKG